MRRTVFVLIFLLTAGFDQGTKEWALSLPVPAGCDVPADLVAHACHGIPQPVIQGYWDWELAMNTGAAFSSLDFGNATQILLAIFAAIAVAGIGFYAYRLRPDQRLERIALGLVAGGALGNLIDRIRHGGVTDFIRWRIGEHRWPIFNVADAALLVGVVLMFVAGALAHRRQRLRAPSTA
ncbi:MAG: signal peptidase II [Kofleriaceae bacterium]